MMKIIRAFGTVLMIAVIAFAVIMAVTFTAASAFKLSYHQIKTISMTPDYPVGTWVVDSSAVPYQKNHPITFVADGNVVTHIFLGYKKDGSLITRGIANADDDNWLHPVRRKDVVGTVLFQVKLFAPAEWQGASGALNAAAVVLLIFACFWWRWTRPADPLDSGFSEHEQPVIA